jgi:hypothetical protein
VTFVYENKPAGPVVPSMIETLGPAHVQYDPDEYVQRQYAWPSDYRGERVRQPLPYGADPTAGVGPSHPMSQYVGLLLLLLGVGVVAYYLGRSKTSSHIGMNPGLGENPCCPSRWLPGGKQPRRRRLASKERTRRRRRACGQPRDDQGRFA